MDELKVLTTIQPVPIKSADGRTLDSLSNDGKSAISFATQNTETYL